MGGVYLLWISAQRILKEKPAIVLTTKGILCNRPFGWTTSIEWDKIKLLRVNPKVIIVIKKSPREQQVRIFFQTFSYYWIPSFGISFYFIKENIFEFVKVIQDKGYLNSSSIESRL